MNLQELKAMQSILNRLQNEYQNIKPSCENCLNFYGSSNQCSKFNAEPPEEWRTGEVPCEAWDYDSIPF